MAEVAEALALRSSAVWTFLPSSPRGEESSQMSCVHQGILLVTSLLTRWGGVTDQFRLKQAQRAGRW